MPDIIIIHSDGKTCMMMDGRFIGKGIEKITFTAEGGESPVMDLEGMHVNRVEIGTEEDFLNMAAHLGYVITVNKKALVDVCRREESKSCAEKNALLAFHAKLRAYCKSREMQCDGGDERDCPFVEYCFRAAAELEDAEIEKAFYELNPGEL